MKIYDIDKKTAKKIVQLDRDYCDGIIDRDEYLEELAEIESGKMAVMSRQELEQILNY